jgi:hypothetical protein
MSNVQKKGERLKCNNQTPTTLLNIAYKISAILLNKRLTDIAEKKNESMSNGVSSKYRRFTIENIFTIRQIFLKVT